MPKAIINLNYNAYVVEAEDALRVANILMNAERYTRKGYGSEAAYYVYENDTKDFEITLLSDERYRMAKLAGRPPE